ncbi:MAG: hypothetical protein ACK4NR_09365 [Micavibrio sp.]
MNMQQYLQEARKNGVTELKAFIQEDTENGHTKVYMTPTDGRGRSATFLIENTDSVLIGNSHWNKNEPAAEATETKQEGTPEASPDTQNNEGDLVDNSGAGTADPQPAAEASAQPSGEESSEPEQQEVSDNPDVAAAA